MSLGDPRHQAVARARKKMPAILSFDGIQINHASAWWLRMPLLPTPQHATPQPSHTLAAPARLASRRQSYPTHSPPFNHHTHTFSSYSAPLRPFPLRSCVVDTRYILQHVDAAPAAAGPSSINEVVQQLAFADTILLNKIDLVSRGLELPACACKRKGLFGAGAGGARQAVMLPPTHTSLTLPLPHRLPPNTPA